MLEYLCTPQELIRDVLLHETWYKNKYSSQTYTKKPLSFPVVNSLFFYTSTLSLVQAGISLKKIIFLKKGFY